MNNFRLLSERKTWYPCNMENEFEFRNDELRLPYLDYLSGDQTKRDNLEVENPELFAMFEELESLGLLTLWGDWSMDFELPYSAEAWESVSSQIGFLKFDLENEISDEQLEKLDWNATRLCVKEDFLPTSENIDYRFNIEGGQCSISVKAPQLLSEISFDDSNSVDVLNLKSGINCNKHTDSTICYDEMCDSSLITVSSGYGDGLYGVTAFDNLQGEIECVIAYFFHPGDYEGVETFLISNDLDTPGFMEGLIPIFLGNLKSNGDIFFGDKFCWKDGLDENYKLARIQVPSDNYLVLGWIDPNADMDRVFFVGLYRNQMKDYLEKVMEYYPIIKTYASDNIIFERGLIEY